VQFSVPFVAVQPPFTANTPDPTTAGSAAGVANLTFAPTIGGKTKATLDVNDKTGLPNLSEVIDVLDQLRTYAATHDGKAPHSVPMTDGFRRVMEALAASMHQLFDERQVPNLLMAWVALNGTTVGEAIKGLPKLEFSGTQPLSDALIKYHVSFFALQTARAFSMVARSEWSDPASRSTSVWAIVDRMPFVVQAQVREQTGLARGAPVQSSVTLVGLLESVKDAFDTVVARLKGDGRMEELRRSYQGPSRSGDSGVSGPSAGAGSSRGGATWRGGRGGGRGGAWGRESGKPVAAVAAVEEMKEKDKATDKAKDGGEDAAEVAAVQVKHTEERRGCTNCRGKDEFGPSAKVQHPRKNCPARTCMFWQYTGRCDDGARCHWASTHTDKLKAVRTWRKSGEG
jgi:hypothetical protein